MMSPSDWKRHQQNATTNIHKPQLLPPHHCIYWTKTPFQYHWDQKLKHQIKRNTLYAISTTYPYNKTLKTHNQKKKLKFHKPRSGNAKFRAKKFHQEKKNTYLNRKQQYFFQIAHLYKSVSRNCSNRNQIGAKVLEKAGNSKPKIPQHALSINKHLSLKPKMKKINKRDTNN